MVYTTKSLSVANYKMQILYLIVHMYWKKQIGSRLIFKIWNFNGDWMRCSLSGCKFEVKSSDQYHLHGWSREKA